MKVSNLHIIGSRWYVTYVDGNLTIGGLFGAPTDFPATMTRDEVIAAIKRLTPEVEIEPEGR